VKIDRKALAKALGIMALSWAALPVVYWLLIRKKKEEEKEKENGSGNTD
jgi:cbb3-type cytochrome oxidase subunit 3